MQKLKKFEFKSAVAAEGSTYEWDKMLDGNIYALTEDEDYTCKATTFGTLARSAAKKRGKTLKINKSETGLVIQAQDATEEQKAEWAKAKADKKAGKGNDKDEGGETE